MDAKKIFRSLVEQEQALRAILRTKSSESREVQSIRNIITEKALQLVATDAPYAASKDLEQFLWKPCFYKRIEDFRKKIRKYAVASATDTAARSYLHKVCVAFNYFLNEACSFYEQLLQHFRIHLGDESKILSTQDRFKCQQSCHRTLIFLGDLSRYRELHSESSKKDWSIAEGFYHQAIAVLPDKGNPHNQLAVLATYIDAECVAVYRYCRSLMVASPFATAEENLVLLFEKNRQREDAPNLALSQFANARDKSTVLKHFLHRFVRLQGEIYTFLRKDVPKDVTLNARYSYFDELEKLLALGAIGDSLLLKMMIISIFPCVESKKNSLTNEIPRKWAYEVAFSMAMKVFGLLGSKTFNLEQSKTSVPTCWRLLGPLSVFCDWIRLDVAARDFATATTVDQDKTQYLNDFWKALVDLLNLLLSAVEHLVPNENWKEKVALLKESFELRGFLPLAKTGELYSMTMPIAAMPLAEDEAIIVRIYKLLDFGHCMTQNEPNRPFRFTGKSFVVVNSSIETEVSEVPLFSDDNEVTEAKCSEDSDDEVIVFQPPFSRHVSSSSSNLAFGQVGSQMTSDHVEEQKSPSQSLSSPTLSHFPEGTAYSMFGGKSATSFAAKPPSTNFSGFNGFGWGNIGSHCHSHTISSSSAIWNDPASDLAAIEHESELYGRATSSLSTLGSSFQSRGGYLSDAKPTLSNRQSPPRPPPGFHELDAPPGFRDGFHTTTCSTNDVGSPRENQLYTTNPFIIGNG